MTFHLPYHFVGVERRAEVDSVPLESLRKRQPDAAHLTHDRYVDGTLSGRILCTLTNKTEMFVGADREQGEQGQPATAQPFELPDRPGEPAIPSTSLRGLVSNVVEAASNSALRILDDRILSYRKLSTPPTDRPEDGPLSAVGMVFGNAEAGFQLLPLTLPVLRLQNNRITLDAMWRSFAEVGPRFRVYLGDAGQIRKATSPYRTWTPTTPIFYGIRLRQRSWTQAQGQYSLPEDDQLDSRHGFVVAQRRESDLQPWTEIPEAERTDWSQGILRVLGCWPPRTTEMPPPTVKKHELFLPVTEEEIDNPSTLLPILASALKRFNRLADERTEDWAAQGKGDPLPFEPKDTRPGRDAPQATKKERLEHAALRLQAGDLVFFRPTSEGSAVAEISFSAIWRDLVGNEVAGGFDAETVHSFFGMTDPELLPFGSTRSTLTPAEQLFGFVSRNRADPADGHAAMMGRLRFSFGRLVGAADDQDHYLPAETLRILAEPKPPSPALYFRHRGKTPAGTRIEKRKLAAKLHVPQGRKQYLHHFYRATDQPWKTMSNDRLSMKTRVTPIRRGRTFAFHVDFDNLTRAELGLLLYGLRPTPKFRHKLGMGKPLGFGSIDLKPVALFHIDRKHRYGTEGYFERGRYTHREVLDPKALAAMPAELYSREINETPPDATVELRFESLQHSARDRYWELYPDAIRALELIGETIQPAHPVAPPLREDQADREEDRLFEWFVNNDRADAEAQVLKPIESTTKALPTLDRN